MNSLKPKDHGNDAKNRGCCNECQETGDHDVGEPYRQQGNKNNNENPTSEGEDSPWVVLHRETEPFVLGQPVICTSSWVVIRGVQIASDSGHFSILRVEPWCQSPRENRESMVSTHTCDLG